MQSDKNSKSALRIIESVIAIIAGLIAILSFLGISNVFDLQNFFSQFQITLPETDRTNILFVITEYLLIIQIVLYTCHIFIGGIITWMIKPKKGSFLYKFGYGDINFNLEYLLVLLGITIFMGAIIFFIKKLPPVVFVSIFLLSSGLLTVYFFTAFDENL